MCGHLVLRPVRDTEIEGAAIECVVVLIVQILGVELSEHSNGHHTVDDA